MTDNAIIILVIICAGLLTGSTNYFITCDLKIKRKENWIRYLASVLLSTCASLTVPLFLQILSNNLLDNLDSFKNKLIFTGFCILAGFFARRYLDDLYSKIASLENKVELQDDELEKKLTQTSRETEAVNKKVEDLEESIEEVDVYNIESEILDSLQKDSNFQLETSKISELVNALQSPKYSLRTLEGISKESSLPLDALRPIMEHLKHFGFTESKTGSDGKTLWRLLKYPIKIYSAKYGIADRYTDVAAKIKNMISNGEYEGIATQAFLGIDDPAPRVTKKLKLHYRINGKEKSITINEGDVFKIE